MQKTLSSFVFRWATHFLGGLALFISCQSNSFAQPNRIVQRIDSGRRFTIRRNLHPMVHSSYDRGRADGSLKLNRVTLLLKPSEAQSAELDRLLTQLHDPQSANYHKWLTPESYADRFGLSQSDMAGIVQWLTKQELTVTSVARARNAVSVSGTAGRIDKAFQTEIHTYAVEGETHYANATDPSLPSAFEGVVLAIHGLHDFRLRPRHRMRQTSVTLPALDTTWSPDWDRWMSPASSQHGTSERVWPDAHLIF